MSNSDLKAKEMCKQHLTKQGFENFIIVKSGWDIECTKNGKKHYFEVKSSTKNKKKAFCGTVMLTELHEAIKKKETYKFIVCKGKGENYNDWDFHEFSVDEFMKYCALTTPILRYAYHPNIKKLPKFRENTIKASEELIKFMYDDFNFWKTIEDHECNEYINDCFDNEIFEINNENIEDENDRIEEDLKNNKCFYSTGRTKFYEKGNERFVVKYSKKQNHNNIEYWYGIPEILLERMKEQRLSHIIFETENDGNFKLPIDVLNNYIKIANYSEKSYGKIFHIYIKKENNDLMLFKSGKNEIPLANYKF
jgi:hypothetical protein